ncbi:hypothetical protein L1887_40792 [Cichorium endivia]|nr:hypothetical protein L1887_40792 [Cichorium endivia]
MANHSLSLYEAYHTNKKTEVSSHPPPDLATNNLNMTNHELFTTLHGVMARDQGIRTTPDLNELPLASFQNRQQSLPTSLLKEGDCHTLLQPKANRTSSNFSSLT